MSEENQNKLSEQSLPEAVKRSIEASQAKMAESVLVLDLREISSFTDFFIIMHGGSGKQNQAICANVEQELKKAGIRPLSVEGRQKAEWILMDYGDFILHVFSEQARDYYELEKLWADGPRLSF